MERNPQSFFERSANGEHQPLPQTPREQLLPSPESTRGMPEAGTSGKSFEELVRDALAEELKYERDPAVRDQASRRADEILAEFAEAQNLQKVKTSTTSNRSKADNGKLTPELAKQLGIEANRSGVIPPRGNSKSVGLLDLVMAIVIAVLLIIVVLLLIF